MEKRLILFLILSSAIFFGWSYVYSKIYPKPAGPLPENAPAANVAAPAPSQTSTPAPASKVETSATTAQATAGESRQIKVKTDFWTATLSSQGGVITEWTMISFPNGKPIDPPSGVNLVSASLSQSVGGPFRFSIPSDAGLEKNLNSALYEIKNLPEQELIVKKGEKREITFLYSKDGVEASKTLIFKGKDYEGATGFDFDFQASVKRNGDPVVAYAVIGPNFGDQNVKEVNTYRHAPQVTHEFGRSVTRETADDLKKKIPTQKPFEVAWAAVDDNYFAMAIVPPKTAPAIGLLNDHYVSIGVAINQGDVNHIYAGPKDLNLLSQISEKFGMIKNGSHLENIISYGWLSNGWFENLGITSVVKFIAQFMLYALRSINQLTNNFGWSIVLLTIFLNMFFFPLRWKSSVTMKRAASMQPKMKDLQERMKKLDKNDPRMLDLQKEQIALMKEGNPLMGCLPLLLQMPFFMAVFAILTVSIEVRHAPFIGWLTDLSSPDPYWILPLVMCVTMVLQQALTPTTADPVQKKVGYLMPLIFTWFLKSAPAGLVLYWMVSNLTGVVQQFVINRLNPPNPPAATNPSKPDKSKHKPAKDKKTKEALAN